MEKIKIGNKNYLYPNPVIIVGVMVDDKPNYLNVSYCGIANRDPAMISISINKSHYSYGGIKENKAFSINIPSLDMLEVTDYCGTVSGKDIDKSKFFSTFYDNNINVPMIKECPINMKCQVIHEIDLGGSNMLIIGKVMETYSSKEYLTNNIPDLKKINPILLSIYEFNYYSIGDKAGKAWDVGKGVKVRLTKENND